MREKLFGHWIKHSDCGSKGPWVLQVTSAWASVHFYTLRCLLQVNHWRRRSGATQVGQETASSSYVSHLTPCDQSDVEQKGLVSSASVSMFCLTCRNVLLQRHTFMTMFTSKGSSNPSNINLNNLKVSLQKKKQLLILRTKTSGAKLKLWWKLGNQQSSVL